MPVPLLLGGIVAVAALVHAVVALRSLAPWIVPDELIYAEIAKSLGGGGLPAVREKTTFEWGLGYPALLAPIWALVADVETAYAASRIWNAVILGSTAVPAFFLARRFTSEGYALVVAAMAVSIPPMLYAGTLLTEVALYPAFVFALLAVSRALERPTTGSQLAVLIAIALACIVKPLAVVLIGSYVASILLHHCLNTRAGARSTLRAYCATWMALGLGAIVAAAGVALLAGGKPQSLLGAYGVVATNIDYVSLPRWAILHLADLDLALAVIAFAATVVYLGCALRRDATRQARLFASVATPAILLLVLVVAAYSSKPYAGAVGYTAGVNRIHERSTFMLAPLFFIGLVMWLRERRGTFPALVAVTAVVALLPALIPIDDFDRSVRFQALALVPWVESRDELAWPASVLFATLVLGAVFVIAFRIRAPAAFVIVPIALVFTGTAAAAAVSMGFAAESSRNLSTGPNRTWVDDAIPEGERVSVLWAEPPGKPFADFASRQRVLFVGEFFNRRIGDVYELGSPLPYNLPATRVRLEGDRVVLDDGSAADVGELVLVPCHVSVTGATVVRNDSVGASIVRVASPLRATVSDPEDCPR